MSHWAASLIGQPWTPERGCWWLVRHALLVGYGIVMPELGSGEPVAAADQEKALTIAVARLQRESGWHQMNGHPVERDIVLMAGPRGLHVGLVISADRRLLMLHADGYMTEHGPVGQVRAQPLGDVLAAGYTHPEIWRCT